MEMPDHVAAFVARKVSEDLDRHLAQWTRQPERGPEERPRGGKVADDNEGEP